MEDILCYSLVTMLKTEYVCPLPTAQVHMLKPDTQCDGI